MNDPIACGSTVLKSRHANLPTLVGIRYCRSISPEDCEHLGPRSRFHVNRVFHPRGSISSAPISSATCRFIRLTERINRKALFLRMRVPAMPRIGPDAMRTRSPTTRSSTGSRQLRDEADRRSSISTSGMGIGPRMPPTSLTTPGALYTNRRSDLLT